MAVHFRCPCGAILNAPEGNGGSAGECPTCGKIVVVPQDAVAVLTVPRLTPARGMPVAAAPTPAADQGSGPVKVAAADQGVVTNKTDAIPVAEKPASKPKLSPAKGSPARRTSPVPRKKQTPLPVAEPEPVAEAVEEPVIEALEDPMAEAIVEPEAVAELDDIVDVEAVAEVADVAGDDEVVEAGILDAHEAATATDAAIVEEEPVAAEESIPDSVTSLPDIPGGEEEVEEESPRPKRTKSKRISRVGKAVDGASKKSRKGSRPAMKAAGGRSGRSGGRSRRLAGKTRPCPSCGEPVLVGARKCGECGEEIKSGGGAGKIIVILLIVVVVAVGALAGVYFGKPDLLPAGIRTQLDQIMGKAPEQPAEQPPAEDPAADEAPASTPRTDATPVVEPPAGGGARDVTIPGFEEPEVPGLFDTPAPADPTDPAGDDSIEM